MAHVPKFGNWDGENVPYTAYFENARKEKAVGIRINPNDPEQNPEAFANLDNEAAAAAAAAAQPRKQKGDSSSDKSSSNSFVNSLKPKKKGKSSSDSPKPGPIVADEFVSPSNRSASVPKFGQWDENDPRSAEGFTFIFNRVKEEKQIAASKFPSPPLQTTNGYQEKHTTKKCCCCLF